MGVLKNYKDTKNAWNVKELTQKMRKKNREWEIRKYDNVKDLFEEIEE